MYVIVIKDETAERGFKFMKDFDTKKQTELNYTVTDKQSEAYRFTAHGSARFVVNRIQESNQIIEVED